jgi:hypothetical protein
MIFSVFALILAAVQLVIGTGIGISPALVAAYGWRNYFLYTPLAFLIATHFKDRDLRHFGWLTLALAVPISALVFIQFHSPIDAKINVGMAENMAQQFRGLGLDATHTRPMGPFTSDVGQGHFTATALAFIIANWVSDRQSRITGIASAIFGTVAILVCLAYSGSRGAVVGAGIMLMVSLIGTMRLNNASGALRRAIGILIAVAVSVGIGVVVFSDGIASFLLRWNAAYASESRYFSGGIFGRALYGFVDFTRLIFDSPILGYGLGSGSNASTILGGTIRGLSPLDLAVTDWSRHILDLGPIFGVVFIAYSIALVFWLTRRVLGSKWILAYSLYATAGVELLMGQITGNGIINAFAWILLGLCLAATSAKETEPTAPLPPGTPQFANVVR